MSTNRTVLSTIASWWLRLRGDRVRAPVPLSGETGGESGQAITLVRHGGRSSAGTVVAVAGLREIRALLRDKWDPLELRGLAPDDEYDSYANVLGSKLKRGNSREDIAAYLATVLTENALMPHAWRARCERATDALLDWYVHSDAPQ